MDRKLPSGFAKSLRQHVAQFLCSIRFQQMDAIKIFESPQFGQVRIIEDADSNQLLFCAIDICTALGYSNGRDAVYKHVEKDDVAKRDTTDSIGRTQKLTYVTESGLYALIFGSKQVVS